MQRAGKRTKSRCKAGKKKPPIKDIFLEVGSCSLIMLFSFETTWFWILHMQLTDLEANYWPNKDVIRMKWVVRCQSTSNCSNYVITASIHCEILICLKQFIKLCQCVCKGCVLVCVCVGVGGDCTYTSKHMQRAEVSVWCFSLLVSTSFLRQDLISLGAHRWG